LAEKKKGNIREEKLVAEPNGSSEDGETLRRMKGYIILTGEGKAVV